MSVLRVALCADFPEERWPSMDRVANELLAEVRRSHALTVDLTPVCPPFARRATRVWPGARSFTVDRVLNRWWDYPGAAAQAASQYELFHIVDHSYSQLIHRLPAERTVVTCHDLDTFRSVLVPEDEPRSAIFRMATQRILDGLRRAARVTCDTTAVRDELVGLDLVAAGRVTVVPVGVGEAFSPNADDLADAAAGRLVGSAPGAVEILHVGSTIPRKRVDTLLEVCAAMIPSVPNLRVVRVGGPFTADQQRMLEDLGLANRVSIVGFVDERTLAAVYRRAALVVLPSEREGFGLPLIEALACGTAVVASDLRVLREVGASAAEYCPVGDIGAWVRAVSALLAERRLDESRWRTRRMAGCVRARCFSWSQFAAAITDIYQELAKTAAAQACAPGPGLVRPGGLSQTGH